MREHLVVGNGGEACSPALTRPIVILVPLSIKGPPREGRVCHGQLAKVRGKGKGKGLVSGCHQTLIETKGSCKKGVLGMTNNLTETTSLEVGVCRQ